MVEEANIEGVDIHSLAAHFDDRGCFMELVKYPFVDGFDVKQSSIAMTYPGVIKAFHWHKYQTDIWFALQGYARCVLYDLRNNSPTYKKVQTIYMSGIERKLLVIPPGVAHGYQVLGGTQFYLLYFVNQAYDPANPDEGRLAFDSIGYDWVVRNR